MHSKRIVLTAMAALAGLHLSGSAWAQDDVDNTIEPQPLTKALAEFAEQTGMQLVYPSELTAGVDSRGASTEGSPNEILDELLASTGLEYQYVNDRTIAIAAETSTDMSAVEGRASDQGGASNQKNVNLEPILMAQNTTHQSQTTVSRSEDSSGRESAEDAATESPLEEIIVTGTNIRGAVNPTAQVLKFDREAIELSGAATTADFLRTVPQNFSSATLQTANTANFENGNFGFPEQVVNIRGVGPGATLVLLNGRRLAGSGGRAYVDISAIPLAVVERVDVLTDGASAIYGSDAVAGAVNFITKTDYDGVEIRARYAAVTDGGHDELQVGAIAGTSWGSGGVFANVDYTESSALLARDRSFIDPDNLINPLTTLLPDEDRLEVAASFNQTITDQLVFNTDAIYSSRDTLTNLFFFPGQSLSETEAYFVGSRLSYQLSSDVTSEFFVDYGRTEASSRNITIGAEAAPLDNELLTLEGKASGRLLSIAGGDISFAIGGQYREEQFDTTTLSAKRDILAVYAEVLIPIIGDGNSLPFVRSFDISVAGRYEDYSDFGETFNPRFGMRWTLNDELALAATYADAFRAPSLTSVFGTQNVAALTFPSSAILVADPPLQDPRLPDGFFSLIRFAGGNPDLKEETATTWSIGMTYRPKGLEGLTLSANYFDISYAGRIEFVTPASIIQDPAFVSLLELPPTETRVETILAMADDPNVTFINALPFDPTDGTDIQAILNSGQQNVASRDIRSIDFQVSYLRDTNFGDFNFGLNGTYMLAYDVQLIDGAPVSEQVDLIYYPVNFRMRGNVSWSRAGFIAFAAVNYTDAYKDNLGDEIESFTTVDLTFAYDTGDRVGTSIFDNTRLALTVQNALAEAPPFAATPDGINYDAANASGLGRMISIVLSKAF